MKLIKNVTRIEIFTDDGIGMTIVTDRRKYTRYYASFIHLYFTALQYAIDAGGPIYIDDVKLGKLFYQIQMVDYYEKVLMKLGTQKKKIPISYDFSTGDYYHTK